jgi:hypothetical protein
MITSYNIISSIVHDRITRSLHLSEEIGRLEDIMSTLYTYEYTLCHKKKMNELWTPSIIDTVWPPASPRCVDCGGSFRSLGLDWSPRSHNARAIVQDCTRLQSFIGGIDWECCCWLLSGTNASTIVVWMGSKKMDLQFILKTPNSLDPFHSFVHHSNATRTSLRFFSRSRKVSILQAYVYRRAIFPRVPRNMCREIEKFSLSDEAALVLTHGWRQWQYCCVHTRWVPMLWYVLTRRTEKALGISWITRRFDDDASPWPIKVLFKKYLVVHVSSVYM